MQHQPYLRLTVPFMLGIVIQYNLMLPYRWVLLLMGLSTIVFLFGFLIKRRLNTKVDGLLYYNWFFVLGILLISLQTPDRKSNKLNRTFSVAKVATLPKAINNIVTANLWVSASQINGVWAEQAEMIQATFKNDTNALGLKAGQEIVFSAKFSDFGNKRNPFDFDFKKYMANKQITENVVLKPNDWKLFDTRETGLRFLALNFRQKLVALYEKAGIIGNELGVLSALTLGYKDKLDGSIKKAYSGAGAMHVLAVSGMHVGIIYIVLQNLLFFLRFFQRNSRLMYVIILFCLWGYALIAGLSPSVVRATLMFSFVLLAKLINRRTSIYNSIAASAMFLLLINPSYLFDVGFQLSYIAVIGIVTFFKPIYNLLYFKYWIPEKLWSLTAVSISAQIATLPITLYYFHQFSVYFFISNIVVSIGALLLILGAILLVVFSRTLLFELIGNALGYLLHFVNQFIVEVNTWPFAVISRINISGIQVILGFALLATLAVWLLMKQRIFVFYALGLGVLLVFSYNINYKRYQSNRVLCIYQMTNYSAINIVQGQTVYWLMPYYNKDIEPVVENANRYWNAKQVVYCTDSLIAEKDLNFSPFLLKHNFVGYSNSKGLIIDENTKNIIIPKNDTLILDYILVRGNVLLGLADLPANIKPHMVVVDGSVPIWKANNWTVENNTNVHFTKTDGAFILAVNQPLKNRR